MVTVIAVVTVITVVTLITVVVVMGSSSRHRDLLRHCETVTVSTRIRGSQVTSYLPAAT